MKQHNMKQSSKGFTLIELMIVIAIIGILAGIGYPSYVEYVKKGQRADAISGLLALAGRMEEYYMNNDTYVGATIQGNGNGTVGSNKTPENLYTLRITNQSTAFYYRLRATPKVADPGCTRLFLDSTGKKTSAGTSTNCW